MKSWRERIQVPRPFREVRLSASGPTSYTEEQLRERERQSYERGRQEAEQALKNTLVRQNSELLKLESSVLESLRQAIPQMARECESGLVALAMEVARKLVADLPVSNEMVEAAIREALTEVEQSSDVTILLHPDDLELLQAGNSPLFQIGAKGERVHFDASNEVARGGCILRTTFGVVDSRRETKFELLKRSLAA